MTTAGVAYKTGDAAKLRAREESYESVRRLNLIQQND